VSPQSHSLLVRFRLEHFVKSLARAGRSERREARGAGTAFRLFKDAERHVTLSVDEAT